MTDGADRLYEQALGLPPHARAAFLDEACRDEPRLRDELASLLACAEAAHGFFDLMADAVVSPLRASASGEGPHIVDDSDDDSEVGRTIGRYRILSRVGSGGMGTVYRAHDTRLDREVALKFLPPHLDASRDAEERLLAEAKAAAALEHSNVCVVHEVGETDDGRPFIAMTLYQGETLKQRLARGALPVEEAVAVAAQIARGLSAAHARGIVHRDVKPGNVMITPDGTVKLLDFGLAKVADGTLTRPGMLLGTMAYMSPEQARGDAVDARSDLWSLGVVLYEMLTGVRPFRGGSDGSLRQAILHEEAEPLAQHRPETPERLGRVVARLLTKAPDDRHGSADALLAALAAALVPDARATWRSRLTDRTRTPRARGAWLAGAAVVALAGGGVWLHQHPAVAARAPERIVVADFANFTTDSLLGDAVSQSLRIDLARSRASHVVGDAAIAAELRRMRRAPDTRLSAAVAREVAEREGVRGVLAGEVREAGDGYVLSAKIVDATTGEEADAWRETAPNRAGVLPAINRLSRAVRARVGATVGSLTAPDSLWRVSTVSLDALRALAQGARAFQKGDYLRAAVLYEDATRLDSSFAFAQGALGTALSAVGLRRGLALRARATVRAFQLRDELPEMERHNVEVSYYLLVGDLQGCIEAARRQVEAATATGDAPPLYATLGRVLAMSGDLAGSEAVLRKAAASWPTPRVQANLVEVLYRRGKRRDATDALRDGLTRYPGHPLLLTLRAEAAAAAGEYAVADSLAAALPASAGVGETHRLRALTAAVQGRAADAVAHLRAMRQAQLAAGQVATSTESSVAVGRMMLLRGRRATALAEVDAFLAEHPLDSLDVFDRPYFQLARFYADAGRPARARQLLAAYERDVPRQYQGPDRWSYLRTTAVIALAEGRPGDALGALGRARSAPPLGERFAFDDQLLPLAERPELARAYDRAGRADSAAAVYERYLAAPSVLRTQHDAFDLPNALHRLAELSEARGDRPAAARYYLRFAELWARADAGLQPRVAEARRRAAEGRTTR